MDQAVLEFPVFLIPVPGSWDILPHLGLKFQYHKISGGGGEAQSHNVCLCRHPQWIRIIREAEIPFLMPVTGELREMHHLLNAFLSAPELTQPKLSCWGLALIRCLVFPSLHQSGEVGLYVFKHCGGVAVPFGHYAGEHCCRKVSMVPRDVTTLMLWPWREGSFVGMSVKGEPQTY